MTKCLVIGHKSLGYLVGPSDDDDDDDDDDEVGQLCMVEYGKGWRPSRLIASCKLPLCVLSVQLTLLFMFSHVYNCIQTIISPSLYQACAGPWARINVATIYDLRRFT